MNDLTFFKMSPYNIGLGLLAIVLLGGCNRQKPKAASKDYTKVTVAENGHRDSVIDNKQRLYNASISEPCLRCVVTAVRKTDQLKKYINSADSSKIVYEVDWASGPKLKDSIKSAGSGLIIHVFQKTLKKSIKLADFNFDNVEDRLYFINDQNKQQELVKLDSLSRLKIRNACFWGVASKI